MSIFLLDCDTGIDDSLAILTAALTDSVTLVGIGAVWGNIDVDQAARNTSYVLSLVGRGDVPVAVGAAGPYDGSKPWFSPEVHGADGQGNAADVAHRATLSDETAVEQLLRLSHEYPGQLEIVAVGPLTNLAHALDADPSVAERVKRVTIMGGAALAPGNATAAAEANILHDPEAAEKVFEAAWPLTMVGLDVTMRSILTEQHRERLAAGGPVARYCAEILDFYFDFYAGFMGRRCAGNHDALAVAVAAGLATVSLSPTVHVHVDISAGFNRGRTTADLRGAWNGDEYGRAADIADARHRVVLGIEPGFEDRMIDLILSADSPR